VPRNPFNIAAPVARDLETIPVMLDIEFAEISDCGPVRPHNEDCVGHSLPTSPEQVRNRGWLFTLADGVGGQERGEVASRLTVDTMLAECAKAPPAEAHATLLTRAIQAANTQVYEAGHGAIASTLVACALRFDRATIAHVGDSRCYLIRNGRPQLLTSDHTVANEQIRRGFYAAQDAQRAPNRNVLSRSIGINLFVAPECSEHTVRPEDILLLCSDGLHGAVPDRTISRTIASAANLSDAAQQLITIANESDGGDNVSVQLIRVKEVEAVGMYRGRPYRLH
jgi:serine/threonine protein phosphatase PrpC